VRSITCGTEGGAAEEAPTGGGRARRRAFGRAVLIGMVATSGMGLAACSGSSQDANHQTCRTVQEALSNYNKRDYPAWRASLAQAGQIAQSAKDAHLRSLAQRAATESNAPPPTTTSTTAPVRGKGAIALNLNLQNIGAFAALNSYCQSSYPS
jgi:hypothetical protein